MNILSTIANHHKKSPETVAILIAFENQLEKLWDARDSLLKQLNVESAVWGLVLWENELALPTEIQKPENFRRSRIISKLRGQGVTTVEMIQNVAQSYSNGAVDVLEYPSEHRFEIVFTGTVGIPPNMNGLTAALEEIKPAHLYFQFVVLYVTHEMLAAYTHEELAHKTHDQLRNNSGKYARYEVLKQYTNRQLNAYTHEQIKIKGVNP